MKVAYALLSVQDPLAVEELARFLVDNFGTKLLATPRTAAFLRQRGVPVVETSGLCSAGDAADPTVRAPTGEAIDVLAVELPPPFGRTPPRGGFDLLASQMDLVDPLLVRSGIACFERTCVVADPEDYRAIVAVLMQKGELDLPFCRAMARRSVSKLAAYEGPLTRELTSFDEEGFRQDVPEILVPGYSRAIRLEDGSNHPQEAWLYRANDGEHVALAVVGPQNPVEFQDVVSTPEKLKAEQARERDEARSDDDFKNCTAELSADDYACAMKAATAPFMSAAPRPNSWPSTTRPSNGGSRQAPMSPGGTTSVCPAKQRFGPVVPRRA